MSDLVTIDQEKKQLIRKTIANNLDENQFELFINIAKSRGLDPVLNQIHASVHSGRMTTIVGIDGFRLIAHRTGEYMGRSKAIFTYGDQSHPLSVELTVKRLVRGHIAEFTATAKWDEYYPGEKKGFMWRKMPETMLEKVCEAKALRMAFANDLSGLYAPEEMDQAGSEREVSPAPQANHQDHFKPKQLESSVNHDKLVQAFMGLGISKSDIMEKFSIENIEDLTTANVAELKGLYSLIKKGEMAATEFNCELTEALGGE